MTKKCSEGLDLNFCMYWSTKKIFVKIGAPLVQKCLALPEYSHHEAFLAPFSKKVKKFHNFKIFEIFLAEN